MKQLSICITTLLLIIGLPCFAIQASDPYSICAAKFILTGKNIADRYRINLCGVGASMFDGPIQSISLSFKVKGILSKEQIRKILVKSAQEILKTAKEMPDLECYLKEPPFGMNNFTIILFMTNSDGTYLQDPCISVARLSEGVITYKTYDPDFDYPKTKNCYEETYEEAMQAVEQSGNHSRD